MNKWLLLYAALFLIGILGTVLCGVQLVIAARYGEIGRVFVYIVLAILSIELAAFSIVRIANLRKNQDST